MSYLQLTRNRKMWCVGSDFSSSFQIICHFYLDCWLLWTDRRVRVKRRHYYCVEALGYHLSCSFPWEDKNKACHLAVNVDEYHI